MPWLTPDSIPDDTGFLVFEVPDQETWRAAIRGALYELTLERNWEQFGALTPEEVSDQFREMWEEMFMAFNVVGAIMMWPTNSAPNRWLICDGQAVDRVTYATLFNLIGTTYGAGNGTTTFNLPDLRGSVPIGRLAGSPDYGAVGQVFGSGFNQHDHVLDLGEAITNSPAGAIEPVAWESNTNGARAFTFGTTGSTTRYRVVRTMSDIILPTYQPSLVLNFIICAIAS